VAAFVKQASPAHWHMVGPRHILSCRMVFWHVLTQYSAEMELAVTDTKFEYCVIDETIVCVRASAVTNLCVAFNSNVILCPVASFCRYVYFISLLLMLFKSVPFKGCVVL
jgi:hypothetical protein